MTRKDIRELRVYASYPAITIVLPCDKDRIHTAFLDATKDIKDEELIAGIKDRFLELLNSLSCPLYDYMIGVFVHKYCARFYIIPCDVPEIIDCDSYFKLDDIVQALNRMQQYWVVDYSQEKPTLCAGFDSACLDVVAASARLLDPQDPFYDAYTDNFDRMLRLYMDASPLPICAVGTAEQAYQFTSQSAYYDRCVATARTRPEAWKEIQPWFDQQTQQALQQVENGKAGVNFCHTFDEVHKAAQQGMIRTLLVEVGHAASGCQHKIANHIKLNTACEEGYDFVFAIDAVIESVRSKGGTVLLVPKGTLSAYAGMVAILID